MSKSARFSLSTAEKQIKMEMKITTHRKGWKKKLKKHEVEEKKKMLKRRWSFQSPFKFHRKMAAIYSDIYFYYSPLFVSQCVTLFMVILRVSVNCIWWLMWGQALISDWWISDEASCCSFWADCGGGRELALLWVVKQLLQILILTLYLFPRVLKPFEDKRKYLNNERKERREQYSPSKDG